MLRKSLVILLSFVYILTFIPLSAQTRMGRLHIICNGSKVNFSQANVIYDIKYVLDFGGATVKVADNCVLDFNGGAICNGTIVFSNTELRYPSFKNVHFDGVVVTDYFNIRDYGADSGNKDMDCSTLINELVKLKIAPVSNNNPKTIYIPKGTYYIKNPVSLFAGFEAPVTLCGDGEMSAICQLADNGYILKLYEVNYVKNLRLTYMNRQGKKNSRSVALACQRSIFSTFDNLTICKAYNAVGYISAADQKTESPTGYNTQTWVSCNFRNIRIYECSNYAFDFKNDIDGGDSGSSYDNIF